MSPSPLRHCRRQQEKINCLVLVFCVGSLNYFGRSVSRMFLPHNEYYTTQHKTWTFNDKRRPMNQDGLEFIFTIGLEGTGHHFMNTAIQSSPALLTIKSWGLTDYMYKAMKTLFQFDENDGLWNMACQDIIMHNRSKEGWTLKSEYNDEKMLMAKFNTVKKHRQLVTLLAEMQQIYNQKTVNKPESLRIPLNSYEGASAGMLSYPNFRGICYMLDYPILELLYSGCADAGVQCSHVYLHRHPLDILKSTTIKRQYNSPGMVWATHLYTSHLKLIESQLRQFPDQNLGCLGFFDADLSEEWQSTLRDMWGWTFYNQTELFDQFIRQNYTKPTTFTNSTSDNIIAKEVGGIFPSEHMPYLELFLKAHEQTLNVCRQTLRRQSM